MTTTDDHPTLTGCPDWCHVPRDYHDALHESLPATVDLSQLEALYVGVVRDALAGFIPPTITVYSGDDLLLDITPGNARSLAAALVAAANLAEGHR